MSALDLDLDLDTELLEALDFLPGCGHTQHGKTEDHSDGPATHVAQVVHDCPCRPIKGEIYLCCEGWTEYVTRMRDEWWRCLHCGEVMTGREQVQILGPLEQM